MTAKIFFAALLMIVTVTLTGCFNLVKVDQAVIEKNQELSDTAKKKVDKGVEQGKERVKEYTRQQVRAMVSNLTAEVKQRIDAWVEEQGLNRYGDPKDLMYAGGTPLFDERTGESTDRYEYILENHPELIEELGL